MLEIKSLLPFCLLLLRASSSASPEPLPAASPQWGGSTATAPWGNPWVQAQQTGAPWLQNGNGGQQGNSNPWQGAIPQQQGNGNPRPYSGNGNGNGNPRPTAASRPSPKDDPDDDEPPRWTAPPAWGPSRTPFGPKPQTPTLTSSRRKTTKDPNPATISYNSDQIPTTTADPIKEPVPFVARCGKKRYDEYAISNALTAGCFYWKKGTTSGGSVFPKKFDNAQRFDFGDIKGTLFEFPLIEDAAYISGEPGPDRVIFSTPECYLAGELTSQGLSGGRYTECSEEY
ncbi:Ribonuclease/ribotoxin [Tothia fuscella]|uniref:ribonuclease T1 n=1 Tax=Tothia fuscella TaxID=1048955 RepID=A0A9P4NVH7_9PEZI|nr:Ribonuclease/ribotoxin [Tothia fuscella]